jgi:glycerol-3-phosphate dehydrogenase
MFVKNLLKKDGLVLTEKTEFTESLEKKIHIRELSHESFDAMLKKDPSFGNIICRCEMVSEAEIIEAIRHGHATLDGIKFYTRAGMGRCQGGFCTYRILDIIRRETGIKFTDITKRGGGSWLLHERIGEEHGN